MRVHLGSDHAGLELKRTLVDWLEAHGHEAVDHGPHSYDPYDDYPVFCLRAAEAVANDALGAEHEAANEEGEGRGSLGIVVGGSGNGEQMAANKVVGVRAALVWSEETASLARQHNDANVISVGGRMHTLDELARFVAVFLETAYSGEDRHTRRIRMLADYERTGELPSLPDPAPEAPGTPNG